MTEPPDGYAAYRSQIEHEDHLMGLRIGWLIGSEAFLFAAYANVVQSADPGPVHRLTTILPLLGIAIAGLILCTMLAAMHAVRRLRRTAPKPDVCQLEGVPPVVGPDAVHLLGLFPAVLLPFALIGA